MIYRKADRERLERIEERLRIQAAEHQSLGQAQQKLMNEMLHQFSVAVLPALEAVERMKALSDGQAALEKQLAEISEKSVALAAWPFSAEAAQEKRPNGSSKSKAAKR